MTAALIVLACCAAFLLVLITFVQMFYLETLRLRTRETPSFEFFREKLEPSLGLRGENGALAFSLLKHTLLALLGVLLLAAAAYAEVLAPAHILEGCLLAWAVMLASTYVIPQLLYRNTSGRWVAAFTPLLKLLAFVARPLTAVLGFLQSLSELGEKDKPGEEAATPQESIDALITAGAEEGLIEEEDRKLIHSVVAFGDKTVREVMTPRPAIVSISADVSLEELRQLVIHEQFSRIPAYEEDIDHVIGFVHVRDMFELDKTERAQRQVRELVRPVRFVPESKPVNDLMRDMQQDGVHMAIVVDEYGTTAGLVTMEDMVEEIVGEIRDEHEPATDIQPDDEGGYIVSGSFDVDHLRDLVNYKQSDGAESTTVGGLVTEWFGRVPKAGESIEKDGIRIEVLAGNELRVEQVRISQVEAGAGG